MNAEPTTHQLCTFRLGPLYLGIDVLDVTEVLHRAEVTSIPHSDPAVEGLINLRGQIATALDLRRRLGVETESECRRPIHVVVGSNEEPVTLVVDAIGDVIDVDRKTFELSPPTMSKAGKYFIRGSYKLDGELLLLLDLSRIIDIEPGDQQW